MSMFDKVKNFFMDEPEEEEVLTKEVIQVEIPAPKEEKKEVISDSSTIRKEEKFKTPVYFDDKDFDTLYKTREKPVIEQTYKKPEPKVEKKYFQPTPIISPVYGILDKNYHKEDITSKRKSANEIQRVRKVDIDDVRKKAFGTLVDDLESTLTNFTINDEPEIDLDDDMFDELDFNLDSDIDFVEEKPAIKVDYVMESRVQRQASLFDDTDDKKFDEDELFSLIDMMHEKGESDDNLHE